MLAWHLGTRYLRRRRQAWLAIGAIIFTVWIPIVVVGVSQGMVEVMSRQVRATEADVTVEAGWFEAGLRDSPEQRAALDAIDDVHDLAPFISGFAMVTPKERRSSESEYRGTFPCRVDAIEWESDVRLGRILPHHLHRTPALDLRAAPLTPEERGTGFLTPDWRARLALVGAEILPGLGALPLPPRETPVPGAIAGQELAYIHGLSTGSGHGPGTRAQLLVPNGTGGALGKIQVEISDTLGTGIYEVDRLQMLLPLPLGRRLMDLGGTRGRPPAVTGYRLQGERDVDVDVLADRVERDSGLAARTWKDQRGSLVKGFEIQRNVIGLVMILVQVLAVFIVYAVFSTLVAEKRHDIGVLIGIGVRRSQVRNAFLLACLAACVGGGLVGWGLGWGTLALLNPFSDWTGIVLFPQDAFYSPDTPISYDLRIPLLFIGIMSVVGLAAAAIPAWSAARTDPITTLREGA